MYNHSADKTVTMVERYLSDNEKIDVLIRDEESINILNKVLGKMESSFSKMVYPRNAFKIGNDISNYYSKEQTNLRILARIDNYRQYRYRSSDNI